LSAVGATKCVADRAAKLVAHYATVHPAISASVDAANCSAECTSFRATVIAAVVSADLSAFQQTILPADLRSVDAALDAAHRSPERTAN
jgi:hypothetical protein